uniref:Avirulence protein n=1 Tax=Mayetiola destructor TaxID=39758 RepID=F6KPR7_MAYDE|nr:avirulence protein [Mayetiola destructor]
MKFVVAFMVLAICNQAFASPLPLAYTDQVYDACDRQFDETVRNCQPLCNAIFGNPLVYENHGSETSYEWKPPQHTGTAKKEKKSKKKKAK